MRNKILIALSGLVLVAVPVGVAMLLSDDADSAGSLHATAEPVAAPTQQPVQVTAAPDRAVMIYELHGIQLGAARPSALLAPHGEKPRSFALGETVGPGVVLETVKRGYVILRQGTQTARIDLPSRLGGSGEPVAVAEKGLKPEPQPPTGELSGAQMAAIQAQVSPEARGAVDEGSAEQ